MLTMFGNSEKYKLNSILETKQKLFFLFLIKHIEGYYVFW